MRTKMKSDYEVFQEPHLPGATALPGVCCSPLSSVAFYKSKTRKRKRGEGRGGKRKEGEGQRKKKKIKAKPTERSLERRGKVALER